MLETIEYVHRETDVWMELTTLLIPGLNDSPAEINRLASWVMDSLGPDVPLHFSGFHPDFKMLDRPPTPAETLTRARQIAIDNGLHHVYTGNVDDPAGQATYCAGCGIAVIERDWYRLGRWRLDRGGRCLGCGTRCAGMFDAAGPGTWGGRRLPVRIGR